MSCSATKEATKEAIDTRKAEVDADAKYATKQTDVNAKIDKARIEANKVSAQAQLDAEKKKAEAEADAAKAKVDAPNNKGCCEVAAIAETSSAPLVEQARSDV